MAGYKGLRREEGALSGMGLQSVGGLSSQGTRDPFWRLRVTGQGKKVMAFPGKHNPLYRVSEEHSVFTGCQCSPALRPVSLQRLSAILSFCGVGTQTVCR